MDFIMPLNSPPFLKRGAKVRTFFIKTRGKENIINFFLLLYREKYFFSHRKSFARNISGTPAVDAVSVVITTEKTGAPERLIVFVGCLAGCGIDMQKSKNKKQSHFCVAR